MKVLTVSNNALEWRQLIFKMSPTEASGPDEDPEKEFDDGGFMYFVADGTADVEGHVPI